MEAIKLSNVQSSETALSVVPKNTNPKPFIEAGTIETSLEEIKAKHIIPVFHKDNEPLISHAEFIDITSEIVHEHFKPEKIEEPLVRVSHPIKGRIFEARNKAASELEEWEKTLFYERMAFIIEVSSIHDLIDGEKLTLMIGGVKAYNLDNLNSKKGIDQHFKIFVGFKVSVCTNLCVWTEGIKKDVRVKDISQLTTAIDDLIMGFDAITQLKRMDDLRELSLSESQFAHLIGKCKMYQYLPIQMKKLVPDLQFGEQQINTVCKDYYHSNSFCKSDSGNINLWKLYNLFTCCNKSSFIDSFADRAVNASELVRTISYAIRNKEEHWFLN